MSKPKYEIREGTDLKWGIYHVEYNVRIAEFYPNTKADREQITTLIQKPEITEKWIEEKAVEIYNYLYYETFNLDQVRGFIRLLVKEMIV